MGKDGLFMSANMDNFLKKFNMRKIYKNITIAVTVMLIGAVVCQDAYALRIPIDRRTLDRAKTAMTSHGETDESKLSINEGAEIIGLIGVGRQGRRHLRHMLELNVNTRAIDRDLDESLYEEFKNTDLLRLERGDASELFDDPEIQAVIIATRGNTHYELVKQALIAGKHVLVEKPFTTTVDEAKELVAMADERNLILMVGHNRFYLPHFQRLKEFVNSGNLGKILSIEANYLNPSQKNDTTHTALEGLGYHIFYMVHGLLNKDHPTELLKAVCTDDRETVGLKLRYDDVPVTINLDRNYGGPKTRTLIVRGEDFTATFNFSNEPTYTILDVQPTHQPLFDEPELFDQRALDELQKQTVLSGDETKPSLYHQMNVFLEALYTQVNPPSNGAAAISVVETLEQIRHKLTGSNFYQSDPKFPGPLIIELANLIHDRIGRQGGVVAIDGPSGAGKTTLSQVLADFYELMYPPGHVIVDPLDEMRMPWKQCAPLKKHILGEPLTEEEESILIENGWVEIEPGQPYEGEESIWYNSVIAAGLINLRKFFDQPHDNSQLTVTKYEVLDETRRYTRQTRKTFCQGNVIFVEGKYANLEAFAEFTDLHVRLQAPLSQIRERFQLDRVAFLDSEELARHMRYYDLVILPSWKAYEQRTRPLIDITVDLEHNALKGPVVQKAESPVLSPQTSREQLQEAISTSEKLRNKI